MTYDDDLANAMSDLTEAEQSIKTAIRRLSRHPGKAEAVRHLEGLIQEIDVARIRACVKPNSWTKPG